MMPAHLLQHFCAFQSAGTTVGTLADAYVYNTTCGKKYAEQLNAQKEFQQKYKKIEDEKGGV